MRAIHFTTNEIRTKKKPIESSRYDDACLPICLTLEFQRSDVRAYSTTVHGDYKRRFQIVAPHRSISKLPAGAAHRQLENSSCHLPDDTFESHFRLPQIEPIISSTPASVTFRDCKDNRIDKANILLLPEQSLKSGCSKLNGFLGCLRLHY